MNNGFNGNYSFGNYYKCCKGCDKRTSLCHDTCVDYRMAKIKVAKIKKAIREDKDIITSRQQAMISKSIRKGS